MMDTNLNAKTILTGQIHAAIDDAQSGILKERQRLCLRP